MGDKICPLILNQCQVGQWNMSILIWYKSFQSIWLCPLVWWHEAPLIWKLWAILFHVHCIWLNQGNSPNMALTTQEMYLTSWIYFKLDIYNPYTVCRTYWYIWKHLPHMTNVSMWKCWEKCHVYSHSFIFVPALMSHRLDSFAHMNVTWKKKE